MNDGLAAYYWRSYLEWRAEYGVGDSRMGELVVAMNAELRNQSLSQDEATRLKRLAEIVEAEMTVIHALTRAS